MTARRRPARSDRVAPACSWFASLALLLVAACSGAPDAPAPSPDQDVLLIVIDTLRADHLGCYGHPRDTSPVLDALAARGTRFETAIAQAPWTAPSMVSLLTGRHLAANMVRMPPPETLAERLAAAGYRTVGFQFNQLLHAGTGFERGFETYELQPGPERIESVLAAPDDRPLFAYVHFVDPHTPYEPSPEHDRFAPEPLPAERVDALRAWLARAEPDVDAATRETTVRAAAEAMSAAIARYDGDVHEADAKVGWLLQTLARVRDGRRPLVIVGSDHGEGLWAHRKPDANLRSEQRTDLLKVFKATHQRLLYEELVHVPLILAGPGVPAGVVVPGPVANVDIVPTLLDLLGLPAPHGLDGRSLLPVLSAAATGQPLPPPRPVFSNSSQYTAVRAPDGRKAILPWEPDGPRPPLQFDLATDPRERAPRPADDPAFAPLRQALSDYRRQALRALEGEAVIDAETRGHMAELGYLEDGPDDG